MLTIGEPPKASIDPDNTVNPTCRKTQCVEPFSENLSKTLVAKPGPAQENQVRDDHPISRTSRSRPSYLKDTPLKTILSQEHSIQDHFISKTSHSGLSYLKDIPLKAILSKGNLAQNHPIPSKKKAIALKTILSRGNPAQNHPISRTSRSKPSYLKDIPLKTILSQAHPTKDHPI